MTEIETTREIKKLKATNYLQNQRSIDYEIKLRPRERIKIKWEYFQNMIEDHHIFTDCSKIGNRVDAAFIHYANKQEITKSPYRLADHNTVYMAEVFTIHKAIDYILHHELYDVKIVSDSRSALMTVESLYDNREFIWQIKKRLKDREDIKLMWVRAHKERMGNERAYLLAKEASNRDLIDVQFTYSKVQIRNINNKKLIENWQCRWMQSKNGKWTRLICPEINMTRLSADFYYNQIITGMGYLVLSKIEYLVKIVNANVEKTKLLSMS
ncbi:hypothetical protein AVEN_230499-1 [Araneus ventricosus]|uniref:ribonuclease H n=1 Tax=Araneus ventricosus TaxID=182803 RepID=A0A4Y2IE39_ARAVE|nr:hypothetical protein AVEN_230499-1 [Araneus ventricosus]